ncbi:hypothetical protein, partial [Streptomyces toyocaensis]|uniref:hypothetical protein n=1 Tax=Streptomyces toyocaensis TaxID=55952 RepID=UPI001F3B3E08
MAGLLARNTPASAGRTKPLIDKIAGSAEHPASAGRTASQEGRLVTRTEHPRVGGEDTVLPAGTPAGYGTPP